MRISGLKSDIAPRPKGATFRLTLPDHARRNQIRRSAKMVDPLKTVNRCGNAFHSRLQLEGQKLRVVTRLVQITTMEPKRLLLCRLPHVSLLAFPRARVFGRIRA